MQTTIYDLIYTSRKPADLIKLPCCKPHWGNRKSVLITNR